MYGGKISLYKKATYDKPTVNITFNGEELKAFSLKSGTRQGCLLSPILFSIVWEVLTTTTIQDKEVKHNHIERKEVILSLDVDEMVLYIENP